MRPRLTAAACLLLAMVPAAISVEELDSQRRWWRAVEIQRHLRLTAAQVARLDALFERELPQRIQQHRQIQDLDGHLRHVIEHDNGDDNHVAQLSERVEALRAAQNIRRAASSVAQAPIPASSPIPPTQHGATKVFPPEIQSQRDAPYARCGLR